MIQACYLWKNNIGLISPSFWPKIGWGWSYTAHFYFQSLTGMVEISVMVIFTRDG